VKIVLDFCGKLPQAAAVSQSIRISDELAAAAKNKAKLHHRSPPQQIEHWAAIGRMMEPVLSYPAREKILDAAGRPELDRALARVGTPEGNERTREIIRRTSARIVSREA